jgi:uncharacterized Zn finger protein (UPF0148 family)
VTYFKPTDSHCPKCGWFLVEKEDKQRGTYKSCINPACDYLHTRDAEGEDGEPVHAHQKGAELQPGADDQSA